MQTRRTFMGTAFAASVAAGSGIAPSAAVAAEGAHSASGSQRRWRTAFGLNGFMSSESTFGNSFPIWEVLAFAEQEGFEGIELVDGWPKPYPGADEDAKIASLRSFFARYNLKIFSIQTGAAGAFRKDPAARAAWVQQFTGWARFAHKAGCECIGLWPGGDLDGQSLDDARDRLIESLRAIAPIVAGEELMASVEIEPPFEFHTIEDLMAIVDGVGHPQVKGMFDPSHFDLMHGSTGKPEELLLKLGVHRLGYLHLTDTDGTIFNGTSKHLPIGDGHVDFRRVFEVLWEGGYEGWTMIDPWMTKDPYDACRKGRRAIEAARREWMRRPAARTG